jgi:tetratricopeptide (TPR) repeat protein
MGGTPPMDSPQAHDHWRGVFDREYARLCDEVAAGHKTLLDPYGTTSQAELFAVATECFFERPGELGERHPELFACLQGFYKLDPREWFNVAAIPAPEALASAAPMEKPLRPAHVSHRAPADDEDQADGTLVPEDLPPLATADQYFTRGSEYLDLGRFELAEADLSHAVRLAPSDVEARIELARVRLYLGRWESALATVERALHQAPEDEEALLLRAICRAALGEYAAATADFDRLADLPSDDIHAHYYRGLARVECGRVKEALADFSRVVALDPKDAEAWYERARCHDQLGDAAAAERDMAQARALGLDEG